MGEDRLAVRLVGEGDHLVVAEEVDLVFADDCAAADGVDADLFGVAFGRVAVSAEGLVIPRFFGEDAVGDRQRGAGRGVDLFVVVGLDDFDVELVAEERRRAPCKPDQQIDAERHIGGAEDCGAL